MTPGRTIARLSLYRRLLQQMQSAEGIDAVFSHQIANRAGVTPAQVRRDLTFVSGYGSPTRGYDVNELTEAIELVITGASIQRVALVGVGNLGRAILAFFRDRRPKLTITAAFDRDPEKTNRVIYGCRCYGMEELGRVVAEQDIVVGVVAVPAEQAQAVADELVLAGVSGILNFAPAPLKAPEGVYVEDLDMTVSLEKVVYFARQNRLAV